MLYNNKEFAIKEAKEEDALKIFNNLKKCSDQMYNDFGLEHWIPVYSIENIKDDIKNKKVFIVEYEHKVIGNFILDMNKGYLWEDEKKAIYLSKLAIIPEFSGKGFGKKCMKFIEEYTKNEGYNYIRFDVYDKSINTIEFYKKLNYQITKMANTRRFTVLLMEKRI